MQNESKHVAPSPRYLSKRSLVRRHEHEVEGGVFHLQENLGQRGGKDGRDAAICVAHKLGLDHACTTRHGIAHKERTRIKK